MQPARLSTSQLEYLEAVFSHDTWAEAAESVGVSPSALSQGITELEKRLGLELFNRRGRKREPTPAAIETHRYAKRILKELRSLNHWASEVKDGTLGRISVGMIDTAALHHFGNALSQFRKTHPEVSLHLHVAPSMPLLNELRTGALDAIICVNPEPDEQFNITALVSEPIYIYAPQGLSEQERKLANKTKNWGPWISFPEGSRTRTLIEDSLRAKGCPFDVVTESSQPTVIAEMVRLGVGWSALSEVDAESGHRPLKRFTDKALAIRELSLVTRKSSSQIPALEVLLNLFKESNPAH